MSERGAAVVFVGPSLAAEDLRRFLGPFRQSATIAPPVARGDVLRLLRSRPAVIAIIDGMFGAVPSVLHKEILLALEEGIHVLGASSMGALRAAELHHFGMEGFGPIYRAFRDGRLVGDDEVAVLHGPAELGYPLLTVALVELRATLALSVRAGRLPAGEARAILRTAQRLPFQERSLDAILAGDRTGCDALRASLTAHWVDRKRQDAILLARRLRRLLAGQPGCAPQQRRPSTPRTRYLAAHERACRAHATSWGAVMERDIVLVARLLLPQAEAVVRSAIERRLAAAQVARLGIAVTTDSERARFLRRRGLADESELLRWLADNAMTPAELDRLLADVRAARIFRRAQDVRHPVERRAAREHRQSWLRTEGRLAGGLLFSAPGVVDETDLGRDLKALGLFPMLKAFTAARLAAGAAALARAPMLERLTQGDRLDRWLAARCGVPLPRLAREIERRGVTDHNELVRIGLLLCTAEVLGLPASLTGPLMHGAPGVGRTCGGA